MYSVIFSDAKIFKFLPDQIKKIPYFESYLNSFDINIKIIHIQQSSVGFEFLHAFATMDEIDIFDPVDKIQFVIKQCDYFCYDKLRALVEKKYGFRYDVSDVKDDIGNEIVMKMKFCGSFVVEYIQSCGVRMVYNGCYNYSAPYCSKSIIKYIGLPTDNYGNDNNLKYLSEQRHRLIKCIKITPIYNVPKYSHDIEVQNVYTIRYKKQHTKYLCKLLIDAFEKNDFICEINRSINIHFGNSSYTQYNSGCILCDMTENDYENVIQFYSIGTNLSACNENYIIKDKNIDKPQINIDGIGCQLHDHTTNIGNDTYENCKIKKLNCNYKKQIDIYEIIKS